LNTQLEALQGNTSDSCQCQQQAASLIFDKQQTNCCADSAGASSNSVPLTISDQYASEEISAKCSHVPATGSLPPSPIFNTITLQCTNMVTRVKYVFLWNGQKIKRILARVVLSDMSTASGLVTQSFEAVWHYYTESQMNTIISVTQFDAYVSSLSYVQSQLSGSLGLPGFSFNFQKSYLIRFFSN
jgi:hypothetical protein